MAQLVQAQSSIKLINKNARLICLLVFSLSNICRAFSFDPQELKTQVTISSQSNLRIGIAKRFIFENQRWKHTLGAKIEVGNREEFNRSLFPNHWWRGIAGYQLGYSFSNFDINFKLYHESIHPTGGIRENNSSVTEYDGEWRTISMNKTGLGIAYKRTWLEFKANGYGYFLSRNQPEIILDQRGSSFGFDTSINIAPSIHDKWGFSTFYGWIAANQSLQNEAIDFRTVNHQSRLILGPYYRVKKATFALSWIYGRPIGFNDSLEKESYIELRLTI